MEKQSLKEVILCVRCVIQDEYPFMSGTGFIITSPHGNILYKRGGMSIGSTEIRQILRAIIVALRQIDDFYCVSINVEPAMKELLFDTINLGNNFCNDLICDYNSLVNSKNLHIKIDDEKRKSLRSKATAIAYAALDNQKAKREQEFNKNNAYVVYTDGSCDNIREPHYGGWAYIIKRQDEFIKKESGNDLHTTNNRMEMTAIINSIKNIPQRGYVRVFTDSKYCIGAFTKKEKDWWKNLDLIHEFINIRDDKSLNIDFKHVQGHGDDYYNNMVDKMANEEFEKASGYKLPDFQKLK